MVIRFRIPVNNSISPVQTAKVAMLAMDKKSPSVSRLSVFTSRLYCGGINLSIATMTRVVIIPVAR